MEQFPVSAYVGSSKNLKDLEVKGPAGPSAKSPCGSFPRKGEASVCVFLMALQLRLHTYHYQSGGVYTEPEYYILNAVRNSPPRVGVGVPILPTLPTVRLSWAHSNPEGP